MEYNILISIKTLPFVAESRGGDKTTLGSSELCRCWKFHRKTFRWYVCNPLVWLQKTNVITTLKQSKGNHLRKQWEFKVDSSKLRRREMQVTKSWLIVFLNLKVVRVFWTNTEQSWAKLKQWQITVDAQLKIALNLTYVYITFLFPLYQQRKELDQLRIRNRSCLQGPWKPKATDCYQKTPEHLPTTIDEVSESHSDCWMKLVQPVAFPP